LLHNAQADLISITNSLAPEGQLYYEVDRRQPTNFFLTPMKLEKQLQKVGIYQTGIYWAAPNFERCKKFIPLDMPKVFQWYFATLFESGTFIQLSSRGHGTKSRCEF
jgi:hypothetical protein